MSFAPPDGTTDEECTDVGRPREHERKGDQRGPGTIADRVGMLAKHVTKAERPPVYTTPMTVAAAAPNGRRCVPRAQITVASTTSSTTAGTASVGR